ncbi:hypothetical protein [Gordonia polyisoprenivorans]|uniref:hypothetical protein n=1 Tax=Gordonia polyisoprenivorans TaxID=84595 RepID=UPI001AD65B62|nr:hypothetical protein [Gordonia polyisoprenivorans]QTI69574.1 hypothetical protein J6U32_02810 [Gordonia polyisoprenivorans]
MSLFELLPSLKGVLVSRSFDPTLWPVPIHSSGTDLFIGETDLRAESLRHTTGFFIDATGEPRCPSTDGCDAAHPVLVTRITAAHVAGGRAVVRVDAALPLTTAIADVAFVGVGLAGATMADITVVDAAGHRRTVHAELPAGVIATGTLVIALRPVPDRAAVVAR